MTASNLFADAIGKTYSFFAREEIQNINLDEMMNKTTREGL